MKARTAIDSPEILNFQREVEVSVVTPMHNEELCVREFCARVDAVLGRIVDGHEIIVVDDGSSDETWRILDELSQSNPRLQPLKLTRNFGQTAAVYAGLQQSRGRYVVIMDGDLQTLPEDLPLLAQKLRDGVDVVSGRRANRTENWLLRRVPSRMANLLLRLTTGCPIHDMAGCLGLRGDVARALRLRAGQHRFLPALVHLLGGTTAEVDVTAQPRHAGTSHYGIGRSLDVFLDILLLWFRSACRSRPLYACGRISLSLLLLGGSLLTWLVYDNRLPGVAFVGSPAFLVMVAAFLSSFGFLSLGFVLELLDEMFDAVTDRKPYRLQNTPAATCSDEGDVRRAA